jgi:hypothetical protein
LMQSPIEGFELLDERLPRGFSESRGIADESGSRWTCSGSSISSSSTIFRSILFNVVVER